MRSSSSSDVYIPAKGDVVWIDFNPQSGREQANRRPALVISSTMYNRRVKLALVCPITTKVKGYMFEVPIPEGLAVSGVVLADQVKSFDWQMRQAEFICQMPDDVLMQVIGAIERFVREF
ncbi:MAG TPA: mRNA-degrading endonuclease [Cyanobacteria bacterium UBA11369]|nr:mRNA-degrading endonuclease [Cyanobacteria bacterium UBA11371]HBE31353.1 mRNA-degrading endonuclease [Cyanobacteria bacterium UBA11368]HBE53994.1 mRNA-degrading endonuclease [Cyanobacteria bacterium UBA11369]